MKKATALVFLVTCLFTVKAQEKDVKTALMLIDIQNDYFKGGKMELYCPEKAGNNAQEILKSCREKGIPIIHIQHLSTRPNSTFFIPETSGAAINERVKPLINEKVIIKNYPNSFIDTELLDYLRSIRIDKLIICGMMTHMCVDATTRAAKDLGFESTVIGDACATKDLEIDNETVNATEVQKSFLGALNYYYSSVTTTEIFLAQ